MTWRLWCCLTLPWHGRWKHRFWVTAQTEIAACRCGRSWAVNHDARAVLEYDAEMRAFYRQLHGWSGDRLN